MTDPIKCTEKWNETTGRQILSTEDSKVPLLKTLGKMKRDKFWAQEVVYAQATPYSRFVGKPSTNLQQMDGKECRFLAHGTYIDYDMVNSNPVMLCACRDHHAVHVQVCPAPG
jgi:hypothetical protein